MGIISPDIIHKMLVLKDLFLFEEGLHVELYSSQWIFLLLVDVFLLLAEKKWNNSGCFVKEETKDVFGGLFIDFLKVETCL